MWIIQEPATPGWKVWGETRPFPRGILHSTRALTWGGDDEWKLSRTFQVCYNECPSSASVGFERVDLAFERQISAATGLRTQVTRSWTMRLPLRCLCGALWITLTRCRGWIGAFLAGSALEGLCRRQFSMQTPDNVYRDPHNSSPCMYVPITLVTCRKNADLKAAARFDPCSRLCTPNPISVSGFTGVNSPSFSIHNQINCSARFQAGVGRLHRRWGLYHPLTSRCSTYQINPIYFLLVWKPVQNFFQCPELIYNRWTS